MTSENTADGSSQQAADAHRLAELAADALFAGDQAAHSLGITLAGTGPGHARLRMTVRADMLNGHGICHGGAVFTLADSSFALACNSYNAVTVAATASIDFLAPVREHDQLTAEAREVWRSKRNGIYEVCVTNQRGERVALFRGRSYCIGGEIVPQAAR